jgi:hypothetical protein
MGAIESVNSAIGAFFTSFSQLKEPAPPSIGLFPHFSKLPVELRLKIWAHALEPRSLRIHLHKYYPDWVVHEQRWEGYAPDWPEHSGLTEPFDGPPFVPLTEGEEGVSYGYPRPLSEAEPYHMVITLCTDIHPCRCTHAPVLSRLANPLPPSLSACRESREAGIGSYIRRPRRRY